MNFQRNWLESFIMGFTLGAVAVWGGRWKSLCLIGGWRIACHPFRLNNADGVFKRHVLILLAKDRKLDLLVTESLGDGVTQNVIAVVNVGVTFWALNR